VSNTETKSTTRKKRKTVPKNESPRDRWLRLVTRRSEDFLQKAAHLGNLRSSVYSPDPELEKELFTRFEEALMELKIKWKLAKGESETATNAKPKAKETEDEPEPEEAATASTEDDEPRW